MTFICTDGSGLGKSKIQLMEDMGATKIFGYVKTSAYLNDVRIWARKHTRTGMEILEKVEDSRIKIFVVGMEKGFTCFAKNTPPQPGGTIFFDLKLALSFNPGGAKGAYQGFQSLHPYVAFLHEVGHAMQFIETPEKFFVSDFENPLGQLDKDIYNKVMERAARQSPKTPRVDLAPWANRIMKREGARVVRQYVPPTHMAWSVRLEYDNIYRHERPICMESGQPMRDSYSDCRMD